MEKIHSEQIWEENAILWTKLSREGFDIFRDHLNTPAFLRMLPNVSGLNGLDIGCGEGYNTRLLALRGAKMTGIDISQTFLNYAKQTEKLKPLGINYILATAENLPLLDQSYNFIVAFMSLMDISNQEKAISEAYRILKPGGFLQFSITHPCFVTPLRKWLTNEFGEKIAIACGDYFSPQNGEIEEFLFRGIPPENAKKIRKFRIQKFTRTLSSWINLLTSSGFIIEKSQEPFAAQEVVQKYPQLADSRIVAHCLHLQCRKSNN